MIRVDRLVHRYGSVEALRSVSFEVPPGQVCGYLGPNGAGKSTTVKVLAGLIRPTSGSACVAGHDVVAEPLEVKKRIGYLPETGAVYTTLTADEYLALVGALHGMDPAHAESRARNMLDLLEVGDASRKRLDTLSKGNRQKVVLAAALLADPEVILLDEPLSGLDANAQQFLKDVVRGLAQAGKTILYCSHVLDVVERLCDRVIILKDGVIVADGATKELLSRGKSGTLEQLFRTLTGDKKKQDAASRFVDAMRK